MLNSISMQRAKVHGKLCLVGRADMLLCVYTVAMMIIDVGRT